MSMTDLELLVQVKRGVIARKLDLLEDELVMMRRRKVKQKLIDKKEAKVKKLAPS